MPTSVTKWRVPFVKISNQRLLRTYGMYLSTASLLTFFWRFMEGDCTSLKSNGVQIGYKMGVEVHWPFLRILFVVILWKSGKGFHIVANAASYLNRIDSEIGLSLDSQPACDCYGRKVVWRGHLSPPSLYLGGSSSYAASKNAPLLFSSYLSSFFLLFASMWRPNGRV